MAPIHYSNKLNSCTNITVAPSNLNIILSLGMEIYNSLLSVNEIVHVNHEILPFLKIIICHTFI